MIPVFIFSGILLCVTIVITIFAKNELVGEFGFDTKFAMHAIRLGMQGLEYLETGKISSPSKDAPFLLDIRNGYMTEDECIEMCEALIVDLDNALETSPLPDEPNYKYLTMLMEEWHEGHWKGWWK